MSQGLPVVATAVGGSKENVVDGVTGFLVPPRAPDALAEAVLRMIDNPPLLLEMGKKGRERVLSAFSVNAMVKQIESLYLSLLNGKEPVRAGA